MRLEIKKDQPNNRSDILLLTYPSASNYAEAYRTLRANLSFIAVNRGIKAVLITSAVEGEGKTNTVVNLSYAMAQAGRKVLMIDTDLRRPQLSRIFSRTDHKGFSELVMDDLGSWTNEGRLDQFSLRDLINLARLQKRTGIATFKNGDEKVSLVFADGQAVDIFWETRPPQKGLLNVLVKKQILTKEEALLALEERNRSAQNLASILKSIGLVSQENLVKELSVQSVEAIHMLNRMKKGTFTFKPVGENPTFESSASSFIDLRQLLTDYLGTEHKHIFVEQCLQAAIVSTGVDNLYLLPTGRPPANPSEVIASAQAAFVMEVLRPRYDFIVLDSSPALPTTDAIVMAPRTDGIILVVKSGHVERKIIKNTVAQIQSAGLTILGTVLNQVDMRKEGYYRYYHKYYASDHE